MVAILLLAAGSTARAGEAVLVDGVVAVVTGKFQGGVPPQVVTLWDLESECRLESIVRYGESGVDRPISKSLRATVLERIVDESIIYREAVRLDGGQVEDEAVEEAYQQLAGPLGGKDALAAALAGAYLTEAKVRSIIARRLVAGRYVLDSLRLMMSFTESEIESAFVTMDHPFKDRELDDVREEFREFLLEVRAEEHRDKLVTDLATRCRIWIFMNPGTLEPA